MPATWSSGEGRIEIGEINPRGWGQINFGSPLNDLCTGFQHGCQCQQCQVILKQDNRPLLEKVRQQYEARMQYRKRSSQSPLFPSPLCRSIPVAGLPARISDLSGQFDVIATEIINLRGAAWQAAFTGGVTGESGPQEEWEGSLIWGAVHQPDFLDYAASWTRVSKELGQYIPTARYPCQKRAGHRAPFIDIGLGSSLGFFWALQLDWDTQFSAAIVTAFAYWADMASGVDGPEGQLAEIYDVLPSLASACATGNCDNLSPMKALAIEYLRAPMIPAISAPPSVKEIWLSRLADVGARESCVLMTGCLSAFNDHRSDEDTRCLVAWGIIHDFYDLPRDVASGNHVNGVLWALFAGFSGREILMWLRDSIGIASSRDSCSAKLLLCAAFVHVTNPRWSVNGLALARLSEWPNGPQPSARSGGKLPTFLGQEGNHNISMVGCHETCKCDGTNESRALRRAVADALDGAVTGFSSVSERLEAHDAGLSAIAVSDWNTLINLSRIAWRTFFDDLAAIATWVDRG